MATQQIDAVSSFVYLTEHVPSWLDQLEVLAKYTAERNAEFVLEYKRIVNQIKPKRIKSPSIQSIHSDGDRSVHLPEVDPQTGLSIPPTPDPVDVDPLVAGNRYLYAQVQRKRKPTPSIRSGASGPEKFRSKNQCVIYYDAHVQEEFESMVKAIGIARNNLRKGRNAMIAARGFQLPALGRRYGSSLTTAGLEPKTAISKSSPTLTASKYLLRSRRQEPESPEETAFAEADKSLESLQGLYETSAHQFLRDGDCKAELDSAVEKLKSVLELAKATAESMKEKSKEEAARATALEEANGDAPPSLSESTRTDQSPSLHSQPSYEPFEAMANKPAALALQQTLDEIKGRDLKSAPAAPAATAASMPTAGMAIEVDDGSDEVSIGDLDFTQFRATNPARMRSMR